MTILILRNQTFTLLKALIEKQRCETPIPFAENVSYASIVKEKANKNSTQIFLSINM